MSVRRRVRGLEQRAGMGEKPYLILLTEDEKTYKACGDRTFTKADMPGLTKQHTVVVMVGIDPDGGH